MQIIKIENAGLVLFAPFLDKLFSVIALLNKSAEANDTTLLRRALLLQYIASGTDDVQGVDLSLNHLLSGNRLDVRIDSDLKLTPQEKQIADHLISILIADWEAVGTTDPQGLRESFLLRPGKLSFENDLWTLTIEPKSFDMILDRLPWDISSVRLAGIERPMHVKWR